MNDTERLAALLPSHVVAKVELGDDCWMWRGHISERGYGRANLRGRFLSAHRVMYETLVGPVPEGLVLDHLCRNRACVNPAHLEPVTHRVNIFRGIGPAVRNSSKSHCVNGHLFDGRRDRNGWRFCQECRNARDRKAYWASKSYTAGMLVEGDGR